MRIKIKHTEKRPAVKKILFTEQISWVKNVFYIRGEESLTYIKNDKNPNFQPKKKSEKNFFIFYPFPFLFVLENLTNFVK